MAKKSQIEQAIAALDARKVEYQAHAARQCAALDTAIAELMARRPKPRKPREAKTRKLVAEVGAAAAV